MRLLPAEGIARLAGGRLVGPAGTVVGPLVSTDSRRVGRGALFVALRGEHADGHAFATSAVAGGAAALLVGHVVEGIDAPQIVVDEPLAGLSRLAHGLVADAAASGGLVTLALTGSSGKTTTKDLLAQVLATAGATVAPPGSLNNEVGLPLTACRVDASTRYLVAEMGARGPGHIAWLCSIVPPRVAAVLNVGTAHLGEFGSRAAIAAAKGEIVEGLPEDGWAVLNADDPLVAGMSSRTRASLAWFSAGSPAVPPEAADRARLVVTAGGIRADDRERYGFTLTVRRDGAVACQPVRLGLIGRHMVDDALGAATMALAAGLTPGQVAAGLSGARERSPWRMEPHDLPGGALLLNDAYNANPDSVRQALDTVARMVASRRRAEPTARGIAVLGDMLELGEGSAVLHREAGALAGGHGLRVLAVGEFAADTVAGARSAGGEAEALRYDQVAERLRLGSGDVVLLKASRGLGLESAELDRRGCGLERLVPVIEGGRAA